MMLRTSQKQSRARKRTKKQKRSPYPEMDVMTSSELDEFMNSDEIDVGRYAYGLKLRREAARA